MRSIGSAAPTTSGASSAGPSSSSAGGAVAAMSGSTRSLRSVAFGMIIMFTLAIFTITTPPQVRPAGYNQYPGVHADEALMQQLQKLEAERQRAGQLLPAAPAGGGVGGDNDDDHDGRGSPGESPQELPRKIDLMLFVVFHRKLHASLYQDIDWAQLRRLPESYVAPPHHGNLSSSEERATVALVDYLEASPSDNATTLIFLATNDRINKQFDSQITERRLMFEYLMPGYDETLGAALHEHGAMNTIFFSNITHALPPGFYGSGRDRIVDAAAVAKAHDLRSGSSRSRFRLSLNGGALRYGNVVADHDNDGVQEWIGVFQHDMQLDTRLIELLRRRIIQRTVERRRPASIGMQGEGTKGVSPLEVHQLERLRRVQRRGLHGSADAPVPQHCCIFFALSYPTVYLLKNPLGLALLDAYNNFFGSSLRLRDLPQNAILDVFVVPNLVFNRMMPFLHSVMDRIVAKEIFPPLKAGGSRGGASDAPAPRPADVMERALAIALGAEARQFVMVQIPLRHEKLDE